MGKNLQFIKMNTTKENDHPKAQPFRFIITVVAAIVSCAVWTIVITQLLIWVPVQERIFDDFKLKLPAVTVVVINASRWTANYWYIVAIMLAPFLSGGVFLCWWVRHRLQSSALFLLWLFIWVIAPFAVLCVIWLSMQMPTLSINPGLSGAKKPE